jgi:nucleoside-diphosphate-sugar epimerase
VTRHQIQRATWRAFYDCSRAEQLLGWRPAVGIEEGLRRSFASLRVIDVAARPVQVA